MLASDEKALQEQRNASTGRVIATRERTFEDFNISPGGRAPKPVVKEMSRLYDSSTSGASTTTVTSGGSASPAPGEDVVSI